LGGRSRRLLSAIDLIVAATLFFVAYCLILIEGDSVRDDESGPKAQP